MNGMVEPHNEISSSGAGDGCTARRNDRGWWVGKVSWTRLRLKTLPVCDDCLINVHALARGARNVAGEPVPAEGLIPRARWRRKNAVVGLRGMDSFRLMHLCDTHRQEWLDWTPGQLALGHGLMSRGGGLA